MNVVASIWEFIQNQILGLRWLNYLIGQLLQLIGLDPESTICSAINFFVYDSIKIFFLLSVLIFII
jgi:hypothetical protein